MLEIKRNIKSSSSNAETVTIKDVARSKSLTFLFLEYHEIGNIVTLLETFHECILYFVITDPRSSSFMPVRVPAFYTTCSIADNSINPNNSTFLNMVLKSTLAQSLNACTNVWFSYFFKIQLKKYCKGLRTTLLVSNHLCLVISIPHTAVELSFFLPCEKTQTNNSIWCVLQLRSLNLPAQNYRIWFHIFVCPPTRKEGATPHTLGSKPTGLNFCSVSYLMYPTLLAVYYISFWHGWHVP